MTTIEILKAARELFRRNQELNEIFILLPLEQVYRELGYTSVSAMLQVQTHTEVLQRFDEAIARLEVVPA